MNGSLTATVAVCAGCSLYPGWAALVVGLLYTVHCTVLYCTVQVGMLGPACSDTVEPIAGVSKHFRTVVISYSAEGSISSDNREDYPYFFRTIAENKQYK